jgi:hypothetical protein
MRRLLALGTLLLTAPATVSAQTVFDFEGLADGTPVGSFYSGMGAVFSNNALAVCLVTFQDSSCQNNTSRGGLGDPTSATGGLFFLEGSSTSMDVTGGFNTGFSFFYATSTSTGSVAVFDGLGGTGNMLAAFQLSATLSTCGPDYFNVSFCPYTPVGVLFAGTARSVVWSGAANFIAFDDITLGSDIPGRQDVVPEPATMTLLATGLAGMAAARKKRRTA